METKNRKILFKLSITVKYPEQRLEHYVMTLAFQPLPDEVLIVEFLAWKSLVSWKSQFLLEDGNERGIIAER